MNTHHVKIWPQWFEAVQTGLMTFQIRKDDRGYAVGDRLVLEELRPFTGEYTGRQVQRHVTYVMRGVDAEKVGLPIGLCILGIAPTDAAHGHADPAAADFIERRCERYQRAAED